MKQKRTWHDDFTTRWLRWLGQKCRIDRHGWVELLSANYVAWTEQAYDEANEKYNLLGHMADRLQVYLHYKKAIELASLDLLYKLDNLWCEMEAEKKYH